MTAVRYDRRNGRRLDRLEEHGVISARIRPGHDVEVVDLSTGGVLVESTHRLMPGARVELHLRSHGGRPTEMVRGHVVRCCVARLGAHAISYRGAIAFDDEQVLMRT